MIDRHEFRRLLRYVGINQKNLCAALGKSESWLSNILHGKNQMNCEDLLKISKLTGISPNKLLGFDEKEKSVSVDIKISEELAALLPDSIKEKLIKIIQEKKRGGANCRT